MQFLLFIYVSFIGFGLGAAGCIYYETTTENDFLQIIVAILAILTAAISTMWLLTNLTQLSLHLQQLMETGESDVPCIVFLIHCWAASFTIPITILTNQKQHMDKVFIWLYALFFYISVTLGLLMLISIKGLQQTFVRFYNRVDNDRRSMLPLWIACGIITVFYDCQADSMLYWSPYTATAVIIAGIISAITLQWGFYYKLYHPTQCMQIGLRTISLTLCVVGTICVINAAINSNSLLMAISANVLTAAVGFIGGSSSPYESRQPQQHQQYHQLA